MSIIKKIGKILCLLSCIGIVTISSRAVQDASISLQVLSQNELPIVSATVATPFIIKITVSNAAVVTQPEVEGLEKLQVLNSSQAVYTTILNNVHTRAHVYTYLVQADKPGKIRIGPVTLPQTSLSAPAITLPILKQVQQTQAQIAQNNDPISWSLSIDKHSMYVGEQAAVTLKARYNNLVDIATIELFNLPDIKLEIDQNAKTTVEQQQNTTYTTSVWSGYIYPQKEGEYILPSVPLIYRLQQATQDMWAAFFGSVKQYMIGTKPEPITVMPLPENKTGKPCLAVARMTSFKAILQKDTIQQGEALELSLIIEGEGNLKEAIFPQLQLPEVLKWYQSKQTVKQVGQKSIKQFDYAVQALSAGVYTLPAQEVVYFDPKFKAYKTIKSNELVLTVTPPDKNYAPVSEETLNDELDVDTKELERQAQEQEFLERREYFEKLPANKKMAWPLFIFLLFMPLGLVGIYLGYTIISSREYKEHKQYRYAVRQAYKELKSAQREQKPFLVYSIFTKLLHKRLKSDLLMDDQQFYYQVGNLMPAELAFKWKHFSKVLLEVSSYAPEKNFTAYQVEQIFKDAYSWLNRIKKLV